MPRIAVREKEKCNPHACGNYLCIRLCPVNKEEKDCIVVGEDKKALIYENLCTGCGICVNRCPFKAITIINLPDELAQRPLHQYGINSFRLYNMPVPKAGHIIGLMGRNGMGKSTLLNILAGTLVPNLGDYEHTATWDEIIESFKGTEAQGLFTDLRDGKITTSLKPQLVEKIPQIAKGSVRNLLSRADKTGRFDELVTSLSLQPVLERDITTISGGELQRVAIAAALMKDATLLLIDEASSYLDIKQRIRTAHLLHAEREIRSVLAVEHDLLVLDYLADSIHMSYGIPKAYGIISLPRAAKNGINTYLSGHMREENIRFRTHPITFTTSREEKNLTRIETLITWDTLRKDYDGFSLTIQPGSIRKKEIVGIVGENGIGKTTFMKMLTGEVPADSGTIGTTTISYKPQYLPRIEQTVSEYLLDAFARHRRSLIVPLELEELEFRDISSLSGGELQRVMIAKCLIQDADLYILDEPSAYLDVEQRLAASRAIRTFIDETEKSAFIVDHDLVFIDVVSDSTMVFSGIPSRSGDAHGPYEMHEGLNRFLQHLGITVRRDDESGRPRINKEGSVLDRSQKSEGRYYS